LNDQVKKNEKRRALTTNRGRSNLFIIMVETRKGRELLGISRHKWKHNIKMDFRRTGWNVTDGIGLA
jgi:hypothetical protein